jgi:hypothetical protein
MLSSPSYSHKPAAFNTHSTLLKYVSKRVLAVAMFIALALLGIIGGKERTTQKPLFGNGAVSDLVVRQHNHDAHSATAKPVESRKVLLLTSWQSVITMVNSFEETFNDPALINYANQQGIGMPESLSGQSHKSSTSRY